MMIAIPRESEFQNNAIALRRYFLKPITGSRHVLGENRQPL